MKKTAPVAPEVEGLVASRSFVGTWQGRPGRSLTYQAPSDCRPMGRRITVQLWDEGDGNYVSVVEGDGRRPDFQRLAREDLPPGVGDAAIVEVVGRLAAEHLQLARPNHVDPERLVAGLLTRAGFREDDFYGGTAWLKPIGDGLTYFIRAEPEPRAVSTGKGAETFVAHLPMDLLDPEAPVQVGLTHDTELGMITTVAPSLEEAIEIVETDRIPRPDPGDEVELEFGSLFSRRGSAP